jgi:hypothetical protein
VEGLTCPPSCGELASVPGMERVVLGHSRADGAGQGWREGRAASQVSQAAHPS